MELILLWREKLGFASLTFAKGEGIEELWECVRKGRCRLKCGWGSRPRGGGWGEKEDIRGKGPFLAFGEAKVTRKGKKKRTK